MADDVIGSHAVTIDEILGEMGRKQTILLDKKLNLTSMDARAGVLLVSMVWKSAAEVKPSQTMVQGQQSAGPYGTFYFSTQPAAVAATGDVIHPPTATRLDQTAH